MSLMRRARWSDRTHGKRASLRPRSLRAEMLERRDCPAAVLAMTVAQSTVIEGESVVCTLRLSQPLQAAESVFVTTANGTASYGTDFFAPMSQQVVFAPGQTQRTVTIATLRDAGRQIVEGNETFSVIARPTTAALGSVTAGVTIADYLPPPAISVADVSVAEGQFGTTPATFTVTLSSAYPRAVTVAYATRDGSATVADEDYVAATGTLTFAAGETSKTVSVDVTGDTVLESAETFQLVLSNPTESKIGRGTGTATITNDEPDAPGFQISLTYANPALPAAQKAIFDRAVARISQIIVGDLPGVRLPGGAFIDDLQLEVRVLPLDPGLNGQATFTARRPGPKGLPFQGYIEINSLKMSNPGIYYTIIHEMLHSMGFLSTIFTATNTIAGLGTTAPVFTGANAVREFNAAFGTNVAGVPLYGVIAQRGSYASHWDTAFFGTEIISVGWDTTRTDVRPFSRITVGAMQDIGYTVNYAAADTYLPLADQVALARGGVATLPGGGGTSTAETARRSAGTQPAPPSSQPQRSVASPPRIVVTPPTSTAPVSGSSRLVTQPRPTTPPSRPANRPTVLPLSAQRPLS